MLDFGCEFGVDGRFCERNRGLGLETGVSFYLFWSCGSEERENGSCGFALRRLRLARIG